MPLLRVRAAVGAARAVGGADREVEKLKGVGEGAAVHELCDHHVGGLLGACAQELHLHGPGRTGCQPGAALTLASERGRGVEAADSSYA